MTDRLHTDAGLGPRARALMPLPRVAPIIPTRRKEPFDDPAWLFDYKYDGFRAVCYVQQGRGRLVSRNDKPIGPL